ncbi:MAG: 2-polyprenylphenol 6-hydroxylase [Hyphomicrobiaceae bacterium]
MRLSRAGWVLAQHGVRFVPKGVPVPAPLRLALAATWPIRILTAPFRIGQPKSERISRAIAKLGPSYIKLGQFLATRADVIGPDLAGDLSLLQDKMPPFSNTVARRAISQSLGEDVDTVYANLGPPIAAASIAQVHKAQLSDGGVTRDVAVKVLRPNVEKRFKNDLDSYYFVARQVERFHPPSRRLKPTAVVDQLRRTTELELDLRLEAAAISEMAENIANDEGFGVPTVDWKRTSRRVLTLDWIDGIPISETEKLRAAGFDLKALGLTVIRSFLRHAMRDGFFHADMHQGNLFVVPDGKVVAVDFGIMGRLTYQERRFLAEILYGLITKDYTRAAAIHFEAGYVPPHHTVETFAQAMRAIGEPIHGRTADEISMADLLGQLFAYTDVFDMETRPELINLQKSMVIVEGVARRLDPELNIWMASEPIAKEWLDDNLGAAAILRDAGQGATDFGRILADVPGVVGDLRKGGLAMATMAHEGVRLDDDSLKRLAKASSHGQWWTRSAMWIGAISLAAIALARFW